MIARIIAFFRFWYDFVVGDDWRVAVAVVLGLALTGWISTWAVASWWVLPSVVLVLLPVSLWRVARRLR
jgi:hypothetical protein